MAALEISTKRLAISKANAQMVIIVAVASFVTVFCLVACKTVFSQNQYLMRVTKQKEAARHQLQQNIAAFDNLVLAYQKFDNQPTNVIGGSRNGSGDNDGSNSKIILDALPSTYDFPALASSLEKIFDDRHIKVGSISGTDDPTQQSNVASPTPSAVAIPFSVSVSGVSYDTVQQLVNALQTSIRPMQIDTLDLSGSNSDMSASITAHTYYQPIKTVNISTKVVK